MSNAIIIPQATFIQDFEDHISSIPKWISSLISNFTTNPLSEILLYDIQQKTRLYISTNGSKTNSKSEDSWIISLPDGTIIISSWNPDFGHITNINLYHSERYASLAFYDNKSYVTKFNELKSNEYSKLCIHKIKEYEAYLALLNIPSKYFSITHVKGYQDDFKTPEKLTIPQRLNIDAYIIATSKVKLPLNIYLPSATFVTYVNTKYIHINFQKRIRDNCFEQDARKFLQSKYCWDKPTIQNIDWTSHSSCYQSISTNEKRNISRYINHRPPSGKMMFD